jgi:hypothetical protein
LVEARCALDNSIQVFEAFLAIGRAWGAIAAVCTVGEVGAGHAFSKGPIDYVVLLACANALVAHSVQDHGGLSAGPALAELIERILLSTVLAVHRAGKALLGKLVNKGSCRAESAQV